MTLMGNGSVLVKDSEGGRSGGLHAVDSMLTSLASSRRQCIRSYINTLRGGHCKMAVESSASDKGIRSEEEKAAGESKRCVRFCNQEDLLVSAP